VRWVDGAGDKAGGVAWVVMSAILEGKWNCDVLRVGELVRTDRC
jgi:hypothetical protein